MKLNISYPQNGSQKMLTIEDEKKLFPLHERRLGHEFEADFLGDQFKGYIFRITGGIDKQGFPMKQGIMANSRVKLLLARGGIGFQAWRGRAGERRRKSVRGCIIGPDISLLNLLVIQKGENEIEGLTDVSHPRRLGPKRASKLRKLFNLTKEDDVRKYVIKRVLPEKEGKKKHKPKAPKIQRLVTPVHLQRRRRKRALLKARHSASQQDQANYRRILIKRKQNAIDRWKSRQQRQRTAALKIIKQKLAQEFQAKVAARKAAAAAQAKKGGKKAAAPKKAAPKPAGKSGGKKK